MRISLLVAIFLNAICAGAAEPPAIQETGHVVSLSGNQAWLRRGDQRTPLTAGTEFHAGDILGTGAATSATLLFGQGEVAMLMKPESIFLTEKAERRSYIVSIRSGALLSTVRTSQKNRTHFFIKTRSATMGVRGTTLYVRETSGQPTFFCPCHGKIMVTASSGPGEVFFDSKHHDHPKLIVAGSTPLSERMSQIPSGIEIGHSDAEISDLQTLLKSE